MEEITKIQVALVTGATRGIGAAIALELAKEGYKVIGTATSQAGADKISQKLADYKGQGAVLNVTDKQAIQQLVKQILQEHQAIDVVVNNAGITRDNLAMRLKEQEWDEVIATNLTAVFNVTQAVIRPMMKQRYGRIINITSVVGASGNAGQVNYAAAKAGVAGFTRAIAQEVATRGVTVNCVAPGFIQTDMTKDLPEAQQQSLLQNIPVGKLGTPADVANAVVFLAKPESNYITGQQLHVNGGMLMQ